MGGTVPSELGQHPWGHENIEGTTVQGLAPPLAHSIPQATKGHIKLEVFKRIGCPQKLFR
jgi:hypothetical protein